MHPSSISCLIIAAFVSVLSSVHAQVVQLYPATHLLSIPGGNISFTCLPLFISGEVTDYDWMVNETLIDALDAEIMETQSSNLGTDLGTLTINGVPSQFNNSHVVCRVFWGSGQMMDSNEASIMILEDYLSAVGSLEVVAQDSTIYLSWEEPFSRSNLTYCVSITNSTTKSEIHSECGIEGTQFTYPVPDRAFCDVYKFTVRPVNDNGDGESLTAAFYGIQDGPDLDEVTIIPGSEIFSYLLSMSAPVCDAELQFLDVDTGEIITLEDSDVTITETSVMFSTRPLRENRRYNVTIAVSNIRGLARAPFTLSTHDVSSISIATTNDDQTELSTIYTSYSLAGGALYYFLPLTEEKGEINFDDSLVFPLSSDMNSHPLNLPSDGQYRVLVYDIESDGLLQDEVLYPAVSEVHVPSSGGNDQGLSEDSQHIEDCISTANSQGFITMQCAFSDTASATGFQMLAQETSPSGVHRLYANLTDDFDNVASVEVEQNGTYLVSIFPILEDGILQSIEEHRVVLEVTITDQEIAKPTTTPSIPNTVGLAVEPGEVGTGVIAGIGAGTAALVIVCTIVIVMAAVLITNRRKRQNGGQDGVSREETNNVQLKEYKEYRTNNQ